MNLGENPTLSEKVSSDNELKAWLVNYVGDRTKPGDGQVTVENIVEVMSTDFPEFLLAIAEENWIRGYHQALVDVDESAKALDDPAPDAPALHDEGESTSEERCEECDCGKCE